MKVGSALIRFFGPADSDLAEKLTESVIDGSGPDSLHHNIQKYARGDIDGAEFMMKLDLLLEDAEKEHKAALEEMRRDMEGKYT